MSTSETSLREEESDIFATAGTPSKHSPSASPSAAFTLPSAAPATTAAPAAAAAAEPAATMGPTGASASAGPATDAAVAAANQPATSKSGRSCTTILQTVCSISGHIFGMQPLTQIVSVTTSLTGPQGFSEHSLAGLHLELHI